MNIGERIKSLRKEKGLTQKELARLSSISEISIRKYENGDRQPKQKAIFHLAKALGVSEGWLMGYDVPMEREEENTFLAEQSEELSCFVKYLESIKYLVRFEKTLNAEDGSETFTIILNKDNITTTYSEKEFEEFQNTIKNSVDYQVWLKNNK